MAPLNEAWPVLMMNANNGTGGRQHAISRTIATRVPVCSDLVQLVRIAPLLRRLLFRKPSATTPPPTPGPTAHCPD